MSTRTVRRVIPSIPVADGAGVKLRRSLGARPSLRVDPLLMLDEFYSDNPDDYLAGFPAHPHRGFETVTYMLDGHMQHRDHMGNTGDLGPGDVQWMTAARGIIHSEMPQQSLGRMRGFQLWINLPGAEKMKPARYRDIPAAQIPEFEPQPGARVRVIAGQWLDQQSVMQGPINGLSTQPLLFDVSINAGAELEIPLPDAHNAVLYVFEGALQLAGQVVPQHAAAELDHGASVQVSAGSEAARFLLIAGRPIGEPVAQYGPFVMNTRAELDQAMEDYRDGRLTA